MMRFVFRRFPHVVAFGLVLCVGFARESIVRLDQPAKQFTESSPLGNGRLGAMIFGGVNEERIVLNESGMWSGSPQDADRPNAAEALPEIRQLLLDGKNAEAEKLVNERFTCVGPGSGLGRGANVPYGCYQMLANLHLKFTSEKAASESVNRSGERPKLWTNYKRELNLATAVARVNYERDGVRYTREAFVSAPDNIFVLKLSADRAAALTFEVGIDRPERAETKTLGNDGLLLTGALDDGKGGTGVRFAAALRVVLKGGSVVADGSKLQVKGADEVVLLVSGITDIAQRSFAGRRVDDVARSAISDTENAAKKSFTELETAHRADYQRWYDRCTLELGPVNPALETFTAPARLAAFAGGEADPGLAALYFDFGRYLLISSSRPGGLPANLQGIWADGVQTPWNGDWHLNINVQMNYWLAEVAGLGELHQPLFALIDALQKPGAKTAKEYYGARGWVAHVITNPWGFTSPAESAAWGATSSGSAWLCTHLWEHWLFTRDREFLRKAYPILKSSSAFYLDMLIAERSHGWLVTAPSNSPENAFRLADGTEAHLCLGATMDEQLVRALFAATRDAACSLGLDTELQRELDSRIKLLAPTRVAPDGRVMEWLENYAEVDPHHRHVSHLWGLFPGHEINPRTMRELAAASIKTLNARGDEGTGWGTAFKMGMWARLGDGERAYALLRSHLAPARPTEKQGQWTGGIYPNLFGAHPPFQIDGNLGGPAALLEMVMQSRSPGTSPLESTEITEIILLPALPKAWPEGHARGLRARGGFEVALSWREGALISATVKSSGGTQVQIRLGNRVVTLTLRSGEERILQPKDFVEETG